MDERRLRAFLAVIEEGGVSRAARRLHVAQPSLSQTLRALEVEVGGELFHRVGRGVRPTAAGEALIGPARQALRALDGVRAAVSGVVELRAGRVELAALATLAVDPLAGLIGRFRRRHPDVAVRVLEPESSEGARELLRAGDCELALVHLLPTAGAELIVHSLGEQELLFVLPRRLAATVPGPLAAATLADIPLVVSPVGTSTRTLLAQALVAAGVMPRIAVEVATREAIVPLVLAGAGAALLPAPLAREAQRRGAVVRRGDPAITRPIGVIQRDGPLSAGARAFLALARGTASRP